MKNTVGHGSSAAPTTTSFLRQSIVGWALTAILVGACLSAQIQAQSASDSSDTKETTVSITITYSSITTAKPASAATPPADSKPPPPFKAELVGVSHSAFSGVMAGFAFAALFLLISHKPENREEVPGSATTAGGSSAAQTTSPSDDHAGNHPQAILLLFSAFLTGSLAALLYSTITGDPPVRSFYSFGFASVIFAFQIFSILTGILYTFTIFKMHPTVCATVSIISIGLSLLTIMFIFFDCLAACRFFSINVNTVIASWVCLTIALIIAFGAALRFRPLKLNAHLAVGRYCAYLLLTTLVICVFQGLLNYLPESEIKPSRFIFITLFSLVLIFGVWTSRLLWKIAKLSFSDLADRVVSIFK